MRPPRIPWRSFAVGLLEEWFLRNASERYYGPDQRLLFQQVVRDSVEQLQAETGPTGVGVARGQRGAWEEYWYDALGRRVLKRTRTDSLCQTGVNAEVCFSTMERYVWDGDQLLYELRFDGGDNQSINLNRTASTTSEGRKEQFGWLAYTHGAGIDAPLDVVRHNFAGSPFAVVLHADFRGEHDAGTDTTGARFGCPPTTTFDCLDLDWPAQYGFAFHDQDGVRDPPVWIGSLIQSQRDASGLLYRRNRYYDPVTGQFTQSDPIGLAGGLNVYGFAGVDPVNFSDPFGLCPEDVGGDGETDSVDDCSEEVQRAWANQHVKVSPGHNTDLAVDSDLWSAVVRTSMQLRADFGISAAKESGQGHACCAHSEGRAIDINRVNGERLRDMDASVAASTGNLIGAGIVNRLNGRGMEVYTPGMVFRLDLSLPLISVQSLIASHFNHVHVSVRRRP